MYGSKITFSIYTPYYYLLKKKEQKKNVRDIFDIPTISKCFFFQGNIAILFQATV